MIPENKITDFVTRAKAACGANLESIILFGSAAAGDYSPEFSNVNLFCVLRDCSFPALVAFAPVAKWWDKQKQPAPLVMSRNEVEHSTDVFTIELLDMQRNHRLLHGEDILQGLRIRTDLHRVQVEYELREKLVLLRRQMVLASENDKQLWDLLLHSLPSFTTLFRHAAIALGAKAENGKREAVDTLSRLIACDCSPLMQILDVREGKADRKKTNVKDLSRRYLAAIEQVTVAVDKAMESGTLGH